MVNANIDTFMLLASETDSSRNQNGGTTTIRNESSQPSCNPNSLDSHYRAARQIPLLDADSERGHALSMARSRECVAKILAGYSCVHDWYSYCIATSSIDNVKCGSGGLLGAPASLPDSELDTETTKSLVAQYQDLVEDGQHEYAAAVFTQLNPTTRALKYLISLLGSTLDRSQRAEQALYGYLVTAHGYPQARFMSVLDSWDKAAAPDRSIMAENGPWQHNLIKNSAELSRLSRKVTEERAELAAPIDIALSDLKLCKQHISDYDTNHQSLVTANLRWVISIARQYQNKGVPIGDLVQEGNLGLMKAAERFSATKGSRFTTFCTWEIRKALYRAISNHGRTVRVPVYMHDRVNAVRKARSELELALGSSVSDHAIASATGLSTNEVRSTEIVAGKLLSLDAPVGEDNDASMVDLIPHNESTPAISQADIYACLTDILNEVDVRDQLVIRLRYGIDSDRKTLQEVADILGVSKGRVSQIELRAIKRLKDAVQKKGIDNIFDI